MVSAQMLPMNATPNADMTRRRDQPVAGDADHDADAQDRPLCDRLRRRRGSPRPPRHRAARRRSRGTPRNRTCDTAGSRRAASPGTRRRTARARGRGGRARTGCRSAASTRCRRRRWRPRSRSAPGSARGPSDSAMNARSGMRASAMPASAPISEVLAVMPSVTMSCTPMIAPTTQSGAISSSEPSSRKRGWMRVPCCGGVVIQHPLSVAVYILPLPSREGVGGGASLVAPLTPSREGYRAHAGCYSAALSAVPRQP